MVLGQNPTNLKPNRGNTTSNWIQHCSGPRDLHGPELARALGWMHELGQESFWPVGLVYFTATATGSDPDLLSSSAIESRDNRSGCSRVFEGVLNLPTRWTAPWPESPSCSPIKPSCYQGRLCVETKFYIHSLQNLLNSLDKLTTSVMLVHSLLGLESTRATSVFFGCSTSPTVVLSPDFCLLSKCSGNRYAPTCEIFSYLPARNWAISG